MLREYKDVLLHDDHERDGHIFNFQKQDFKKYCKTNQNKLNIWLKTFHLKAMSKAKKGIGKTW